MEVFGDVVDLEIWHVVRIAYPLGGVVGGAAEGAAGAGLGEAAGGGWGWGEGEVEGWSPAFAGMTKGRVGIRKAGWWEG